MTRNLNPGPPLDGGTITRPGRRQAHMPRVPRLPLTRPAGTEGRAEHAVITDPSLVKALGDLSRVLRRMAPLVLGTEVIALDASGQAARQFRVPFAAVAVLSESAAALIVTSSTPGPGAPGPGPGAGRIPPRCYVVHNLAGYSWTIYGGAANDLVTVTTFGQAQTPAAAKLG